MQTSQQSIRNLYGPSTTTEDNATPKATTKTLTLMPNQSSDADESLRMPWLTPKAVWA